MLYFLSDYTEGAHPRVLEHLTKNNLVSLPGYGGDDSTEKAKEKLRAACGREDLQIWFLTGGTQTNQIAISSMLRTCEGVIAADTAHINGHEAGAIEYSGHKVLTVPHVNGKVTAENLRKYMERFLSDESMEHLVQPGMVYISHPTEYGTLYSKAELTELYAECGKYGLTLYMDGARLGYGLMSPAGDLTLSDICELTDLFYIGGTKVGALCGEALVFTKNNMPKNFLAIVKQRGALLAKMRLVSQQFEALFTDGLYFEISRHALTLAMKLKKGFTDKGYELFMDSPTNQQFFVMSRADVKRLSEYAAFEIWEPIDEKNVAVRFVTSWATREAAVDELIGRL